MKKYSNKYQQYIKSKQWRQKSKNTIKLTRGRCVLFPFLKALHTHHLHYKSLTKETVLLDIIPLSKFAHKLVHFWLFWNTPIRVLVNWFLRVLFLVWFTIGLFI